ncbi:MAG: nitronate monooxygenase [Armatimonadetes bacterium]|nr:nitronate monooxygenase [Armatimonadota bacterium]
MLHTRICDRLKVAHPILGAPMAGAAGGELAAAVSEAGGFGMIGGTTPDGPDALCAMIRAAKARTDRPFGVGFISSAPGLDALVRVALDEGVAALAHSFADPTPWVQAAHDAGVKVFAQVQTVAQARIAAHAGVDLIAAQGTEAGGHTGYSGLLPFLPAVIDAAEGIPVVAAGGIADGRGLAAALMLGAEGAWIGTRFVASAEALSAPWAKSRVVEAGTDDTVLTRVYDLATQAPFPPTVGDRVLRNDYTDEWHGRNDEVVRNREELAGRIGASIQAGDTRVAPVRAGNAAGLIHDIRPAGEILRSIVEEAERILRERPRQVIR